MRRPRAVHTKSILVRYRKVIPKMPDDYTRGPSCIESHELETNSGSWYSVCDDLRTSSDSTTYGEDVALGLPWRTSSSNDIKVDTIIV